jgi:DNA invertase Pin-like site-specific DNA recombinase
MQYALAYARVSTMEQAQNQTIEPQIAALQDYAREHGLGLVPVSKDPRGIVYADDGVSGDDADRALRLVRFLEEHQDEIDYLLITYFDRLARDLYLQLWIEKEAKKLDIEIRCVHQEHLNGDEPFTVAFRQMVGVFAELEKKLITVRMKAGVQRRFDAGYFPGGNPPYGYCWWYNPANSHDKRLVQHPQEAAMVRRMYEILLTPDDGRRRRDKWDRNPIPRLARQLRYEGFIKRNGKPWRSWDLIPILVNPFNCGWQRRNGKWLRGKHEPMTDEASWRRAADLVRSCQVKAQRLAGLNFDPPG